MSSTSSETTTDKSTTTKPVTESTSTSKPTTKTPVELTCHVLTPSEYLLDETGYWQDYEDGQPINHNYKHQLGFHISDAAEDWAVKISFMHVGEANTYGQTDLKAIGGELAADFFELGGKWPIQAGQQEIHFRYL